MQRIYLAIMSRNKRSNITPKAINICALLLYPYNEVALNNNDENILRAF